MSNSLQDQLLKAGLITDKKVKDVKKEKKKQAKSAKNQKRQTNDVMADGDLAVFYAKKAQLEKIERDKALNEAKEAARAKKALKAKVKQIITQHRQNVDDAGVVFRYLDDTRVRQVYVSESQHKQLANGQLAIALFGGKTHLIDNDIAKKLQDMSYDKVFFFEKVEKVENADDPYAKYQVPDDLMW